MAEPDDDLKDEVAQANASAGQPLLDRGRTLYEAGDLLGAVALWQEALEFDPDLTLAREYIDYVEQNYDALVAEFTGGPDEAADAGTTGDGEDRDGARADTLPPAPAAGDNLEDGLAAVDAGLDRALDSPYGGIEEVGNEILLEDRSALPTQRPRGDALDDYQVLVGNDDDDDDDGVGVGVGVGVGDKNEDLDDEVEEEEEPRSIEMEAMAPDEEDMHDAIGPPVGFDGFRGELEVTQPSEGPRPDPFAATAQVPPVMPIVIQPRFGGAPRRDSDPGAPPVRPRPSTAGTPIPPSAPAGAPVPPKRFSPTAPPVSPAAQGKRFSPTSPPVAPMSNAFGGPVRSPSGPTKTFSPTPPAVAPTKRSSPTSPPVAGGPAKTYSPSAAPVAPRSPTVPPVASARSPSFAPNPTRSPAVPPVAARPSTASGPRSPTQPPVTSSRSPSVPPSASRLPSVPPVAAGRTPSGGNRAASAGPGGAASSLAGRGGARDFNEEDSMESRATGRRPGLDPNLHGSAHTPDTDEPTRPADRFRRAPAVVPPPHGADDFELEQTADFDDLRRTREHSSFYKDHAEKRPVVPRPAGAPAVIVDQDLLHELDEIAHEDLGADDEPIDLLSAPPARRDDPDRTSDYPRSPAGAGKDSRDDRIRRRVEGHLREAQEAADKGDFITAVTAVESAQRDDDEGKVVPVLLHRQRDLLYRIYEGHIGDMTAVPLVAVPLHEIAAHALDHRTGFLLSRIDGMLTFEDILDVAGMPRMEAYQILSNLLRKGVIEVR